MSLRIEIKKPSEIDYEAYCNLQRAAFGEVLEASGHTVDFMTPDFYGWKYNPPAGPAKIALMYEGASLVAANACFPMQVVGSGQPVWQSCDTATHPESRGRGCFSRLIAALAEELSGAMFCGFPNRNSCRGFEKLGWKNVCIPSVVVCPSVLGRVRRTSHSVERGWDFDVLAVARPQASFAIMKSRHYLQWRYQDHPIYEYVMLHDKEHKAWVVVRSGQMFGRRVALWMDQSTGRLPRSLAVAMLHYAQEQSTFALVGMSSRWSMGESWRTWFVRAPAWAVPRQPRFMGMGPGELINGQWEIVLGDWDAL